MTEYYPPGTFDSATPGNTTPNDPNKNFNDDHSFSGWGDINRSEDDSDGFWEPTSEGESGSTNTRSRASNAAAQDTVTDVPEFGRAFAQAGAGGSVGDDDMINHAYGES